MENFNEFKKAHYGAKAVVQTEGGMVMFNPDSQKEVVGAEKMTYDEYLDVQIASLGKLRREFVNLYFNIPMGFKGEIEKVNKDKVCFKRIFTLGMFFDGGMFDGKEDHVWMDKKGFEKFKVGDSVEFFAEVYRYVKTGNGKQIDFGLRNPEGIKQIPSYKLPTDEELAEQSIMMIMPLSISQETKAIRLTEFFVNTATLTQVGFRTPITMVSLQVFTVQVNASVMP